MTLSPIRLQLPKGKDVRSISLDMTCDMLRAFGFSEEQVSQARKEAEETDSDAPLQKLLFGGLR